MQQTIEGFVVALRQSGIPVSIGETIDAVRTTDLVGPGDRRALKNALRIALAKTADENRIYDDCFDLYFSAGPEVTASPDGERQQADALGTLMAPGNEALLAEALARAAAEIGVENIRFFTQRGLYARRIADQIGLADMEGQIAGLRAEGGGGGARADAMEGDRTRLLGLARELVEQNYRLYGVPAAQQLREEMLTEARLSAIESRDAERMHALVRRLAKRLAARYRRRRKVASRGQVDVRRMIRTSAAHDGVMFDLIWKRRRLERPKVVVICDVSRSVAAVSRFLLLFLYSLQDVIKSTAAFAFSDRLHDVGDLMRKQEPAVAIARILDEVGFRSTDYGRTLADLERDHWTAIDRRTTVIFMGDARGNYLDPRIDIMRALEARCRRVIWLNPEPRTVWGSGDSEMLRYLPFCAVARECNTLKQLNRAMDDVLRKPA